MSALTSANSHAPTSAILALIRHHPVAAYLIMVTTGAWLSLLPVLFFNTHIPQPFGVVINIVVFVFPAFLVTAITDGRVGMQDLLERSLHWRVGIRWYVLALLGIPVGMFLIATMFLGGAPLEALINRWTLLVTVFVPKVLIALVTVQFFEELGWTGFVQHTLQKRHRALWASLMVAPVFTLWHLPTYFIGAPITGEKVVQVLVQMVAFAVFAMFFRVLHTWVYNSSGRSVLIAALLHAVFNTVSGSELTSAFFPGSAGMWLPLAAVALIAVLVTVFTRGSLAYEPTPGASVERIVA